MGTLKSLSPNQKENSMFKTNYILMLALTLFLSAAINSCKEKNNNPVKSEDSKSIVSKDTLQNQAWQMELQYWDYVELIKNFGIMILLGIQALEMVLVIKTVLLFGFQNYTKIQA